MNPSGVIDVEGVIRSQPVRRYHWFLFIVCTSLAILEGIDNVILSVAAPSITDDLKLSVGDLASMFTAGIVGLVVGAFGIGQLGDYLGRRVAVLTAAALLGLPTLLFPVSSEMEWMLAMRFFVGMGVGGILPSLTTYVSEFAPGKYVSTAILIVLGGGYCIGSTLAATAASWIVPNVGWRVLFYLCGSVTLLVFMVALACLPESISFLVAKGRHLAKAMDGLRRIAPDVAWPAQPQFAEISRSEAKPSLKMLFGSELVRVTVLLSATYLITFSLLYFLSQWLPTLARDSGFTLKISILTLTMLSIGGGMASFILGPVAIRFGKHRTIAANFALMSIAMILIAEAGSSDQQLLLGSFLAGWTVGGGYIALYALAADCYPSVIRSSAVGFVTAFGRAGSTLSPVIVGLLLSGGWEARQIFLAAIVPALACAACVLLLAAVRGRQMSGVPAPS